MVSRLVLVLALIAVAISPAAAQQPDPLQRAQATFDEAQRNYAAQNYDAAAEGFKRAYEARPLPVALFNAAAAHHMKGKGSGDVASYELAVQYYTKYVEAVPDAKDRPAIEKSIGVLSAEIARIKTANASATPPPDVAKPSVEVNALGDIATRSLVVIETEPQGANIYLDDKKNGVFAQTPWSGSLDGQHRVLIEKRGHKAKDALVTPDPNRLVVLQVVLSEEDYLGWLEIKSNVPGAQIFVDDKAAGAIGETPYSGNFKPGKHKIWIAADGYDEHTEDIEVVAGETHEIAANLIGAPVGYLNIQGAKLERAKIKVDGKVVCEKGPCRTPVRQGKRTIVVSRGGYKSYKAKLEIQAKTELVITPTLAPTPSRLDAVIAYVFTGILAGGATGAYLYAGKLEPTDSLYDKRDYLRYGAYAGWGLAGVVGLSAIYYTFRDKGPPSTGTVDVRALSLSPAVGDGYAGLSVGGGF